MVYVKICALFLDVKKIKKRDNFSLTLCLLSLKFVIALYFLGPFCSS